MQIENVNLTDTIDIDTTYTLSPESSSTYLRQLLGCPFTACNLDYWILPGSTDSDVYISSPVNGEVTAILYFDAFTFETRLIILKDIADQVKLLTRSTVVQDAVGQPIVFIPTIDHLEDNQLCLKWEDEVFVRTGYTWGKYGALYCKRLHIVCIHIHIPFLYAG
jgi:hypothetical protein